MSRILFIVNPAAFGGLGSASWERFAAEWQDAVAPKDVVVTNAPGHATEVAASADGYMVVAAVGGDGTVREVVGGIMARGGDRPELAILPGGTGNDVARSLGILTIADGIAALQAGRTAALDLIRIDCHNDGSPVQRYACLTASAGVSAVVIHCLKPWMKRVLGAERAYMLATVLAVLRYRPTHMTVRCSEGEQRGPILMVNVGNAEWESGGSMRMSPGAQVDDGRLNVCLIAAAPKLRLLRKLPLILTGDHIYEPEVSYFPVTGIEVDSDPPVGLQMDGDAFGLTPATFTVCPGALRVLVPPAAPDTRAGGARRP